MTVLWWQEKQVDKNGNTNYGADHNQYCICGSPDAIFQVYFMLENTNRNFRYKLSYNGMEVQVGNGLFHWWKGTE